MSKKTVTTIVESGNEYLIQVKGNQPTLLQSIKDTVAHHEALSTSQSEEYSRGRYERRTVTVFAAHEGLPTGWTGLQRLLHVERLFLREGERQQAHSYYISSVESNEADTFAGGVRGHWSIENRLHWVKDVIQHEDGSRIRKGNGVETLSVLKNIAINICRELGFDSIKHAGIYFASNVKELCEYFRT